MDICDDFIHSCEDGVGVGRQMKDNILIFKSGRFSTHTLASAAEAMEETHTHVHMHSSFLQQLIHNRLIPTSPSYSRILAAVNVLA